MRFRQLLAKSTLMLLALLALAPAAHADFGLHDFDFTFEKADGSPEIQAGMHPYQVVSTFNVNTTTDPFFGEIPDGEVKDLTIEPPLGLIGSATAVPQCIDADFYEHKVGDVDTQKNSLCPDETAVGVAVVELNSGNGVTHYDAPVFNLEPTPGEVARLGFPAVTVPVTVDIRLSEDRPYRLIASVNNVSQARQLVRSTLTLWGEPADPAHDPLRGSCVVVVQGSGTIVPGTESESRGSCPYPDPDPKPYLTLPTACTGLLAVSYDAQSWEGAIDSGQILTPEPTGVLDCDGLDFEPRIGAKPTNAAASSPIGIDVSVDVEDEGLVEPGGRADSTIKRTEVTLPEGFTTNPSIAQGLDGCTEAQLAQETSSSAAGAGCPNPSKIGTLEVETPLLEQKVSGSLYAAMPYANPFGTLLAVYMVIKDPALGVSIKQALKVEPDPITGQLTAVADDLPQLPFSHFRVHFREGNRSALVTPPGCGTYKVEAVMTPWSGGAPYTTDSAFEITTGPGGGACASGMPPLNPELVAGTTDNTAGQYSPFELRLTRTDVEQELRRFSVKMPRGLIGRLVGISYCPDSAIQAAGARSGSEEQQAPSCPAASEIGRTLVGAGVGPSLTYVPGKLYLAGPYGGARLSVVAITGAKVGPFDLGTVVIRQGLKIDPETAEVSLDPGDPLPRILKGLPVYVRDIRVAVDRSNFVLNPTSCQEKSVGSEVTGAGLDLISEADNQTATVSSRFQAANCSRLPFGPRLALRLEGGTRRGMTPQLRAVLTFGKGNNANISRARVTLPHSLFLEQSHIRTICTRVQFAQGSVPGEKCPKGSIYGKAQAITPLLADPLAGNVYLRSSDHPLPDLVAALHNEQVSVNLVGRIDSLAKSGRIRNTFEAVPDAPVTKFVLEMKGGKKSLLVNSTNLCRHKQRANAKFLGQNGKSITLRPIMKATCKQH